MLYLQQANSSAHSLSHESMQALHPTYRCIDGIWYPPSKLRSDGTPKPKYDYRVPQAAACETNFRHSHWKPRRDLIMDRLTSAGESTFALDRFQQCGSGCTVEVSPSTKKIRLVACYCHSRHCEPCMRAKANRIVANLRKKLDEENAVVYRFITLTLKHTDTPLADQIARLYAGFKKLRNFASWKQSQRGGAATLEVKFNPKDRKWHPHLHIISGGNFLHKRDLSADWKRATGDSSIVDIALLDGTKDVAHYVAKYITKGTNAEVWADADASQEWILATKGVRSCLTYGTWRGYRLLQVTQEADDWKPVTSLIKLYEALDNHEEWAVGMMTRLDEKRLAREKSKPPQLDLFKT